MADAVAVVSDLIFSTKIVGTGRALGIEVQSVTTPEALGEVLAGGGVRLVIVDMSLPGDIAVLSLQRAAAHSTAPATLAFYSHVQAELVESAKAAGATMTMPRSKFSADLPQILKSFGPPAADASATTS